jgi:hypothetical protein
MRQIRKLNSIFLITLLLLLGSSQCKRSIYPPPDNPYGLPNATQEGKNTLGCLLNAQKYIAYVGSPVTGAKYVKDTIGVEGSRKITDYYVYIGFQITGNPIQIGTQNINGMGTYGIFGTDSTCQGISFLQTTTYAISGAPQLTKLDTVNHIVSGTFNCIFPIPICDTIYITYGRFDFNYY